MKVKITDMNSHRRATRDLLLEYDSNIMPPHPRAAGLNYVYNWLDSNAAPDETYGVPPMPTTSEMHMIYPWENTNLGILSSQLYHSRLTAAIQVRNNNLIHISVTILNIAIKKSYSILLGISHKLVAPICYTLT